jgi:enamine deaminase RidA (YjgF/YER057c/UK114 family)
VGRKGSGSSTREMIVPREWAAFYEVSGVPAAVRVGNTVRLSGHTGENSDAEFPPDPQDQMRGTFQNIALTLAEAGCGWKDVVELTSYHVGLRAHFPEIAFEVASEFLEKPYPAWTAVGVTELYDLEALVEISCIAIIPPS